MGQYPRENFCNLLIFKSITLPDIEFETPSLTYCKKILTKKKTWIMHSDQLSLYLPPQKKEKKKSYQNFYNLLILEGDNLV